VKDWQLSAAPNSGSGLFLFRMLRPKQRPPDAREPVENRGLNLQRNVIPRRVSAHLVELLINSLTSLIPCQTALFPKLVLPVVPNRRVVKRMRVGKLPKPRDAESWSILTFHTLGSW
jgi:hypothetical protein